MGRIRFVSGVESSYKISGVIRLVIDFWTVRMGPRRHYSSAREFKKQWLTFLAEIPPLGAKENCGTYFQSPSIAYVDQFVYRFLVGNENAIGFTL